MDPNTRLYMACSEGMLEAAEAALAEGASPDATGGSGDTPCLSVAAHLGQLDLVRILLAAGASANRHDGDRLSPLMHAIAGGHAAVAQVLLTAGATLSEQGRGARELHDVIRAKHVGLLRTLVEANADLSVRLGSDTVLTLAVREADLTMVRALVDAGADLDTPGALGRPPLLWALRLGRENLVTYLRACGASSLMGLAAIVTEGAVEDLDAYLDEGGDVNVPLQRDKTALLLAAAFRREDMVEVLLAAGANVKAADKASGMTALHEAASAARTPGDGSTAIIGRLVDAGAPIDKLDMGGRTALWWGVHRRSRETVGALLRGKASVEVPGPKQKRYSSVLEEAVEQGDADIIKLLVEAGALSKGPAHDAFLGGLEVAKTSAEKAGKSELLAALEVRS